VTKTQTKTQDKKTQDEKQAKGQRQGSPTDPLGDEGATNDVRLVGRLTGTPALVALPSGDELVTFRISVPRSARAGTTQRVDSVPCTAWTSRLRRSILTWRTGDLVEVSGAVRCRFYQAGGATRSRVEVEATTARVMRRSSAA